jgi:tetratricopeptide (TPR) repeat protein
LLDDDGLGVVEHLVDQSLLKVVDTPLGARFRMLEAVREFCTAEREAAGETDRVVDRFLAWARDFGAANHEAPFGADMGSAMERIRAERDNLAQALRYGLARSDGATVAAAAAVLGAMWTVESNYGRLAVLGCDTAWLLSHYRPAPEFVELTRTAATLSTVYSFMILGPHAVRSLVVLRRLPPAPPDTLARAVAAGLCAAPELDAAGLAALCDSAEPLLAGVANAVASYLLGNSGDTDGALKAAERMLEAFDHRAFPLMHILASSRLAELYMHTDQGDQALRHLRAALLVHEQHGNWSDVLGLRWALALASLQVGAVDDAEHWLDLVGTGATDETFGARSFYLAVRAELHLARAEVDVGLGLWRRAVELLMTDSIPGSRVEPGLEPWALEIKTVVVVAHAQHGRPELVAEMVSELAPALAGLLTDPVLDELSFVTGLPLCGALLLALAMVDVDRGERTGDRRAARSGARLVALAERFRYLRQFQPTMSAARARQAAEQADRSAYDDAVSSYADLDRDGLRAAALVALRERG